jgi:hypothetical protein
MGLSGGKPDRAISHTSFKRRCEVPQPVAHFLAVSWLIPRRAIAADHTIS